ncbi:C-5 cytosine-specific DNA methylase (plasmid) [Calothrix brevissima NIES-22]|nr:C-5 cytosine-specific DNA methylase [Calothrix brevissima NIES-22]
MGAWPLCLEAVSPAQPLKLSKQKGCLYKYLENKKLKDGRIVTYPRIIEDKRDPDKPQHWPWGFNWEEKIDGEWKGRSIGSVPVGAIPMIQEMQNKGVPLQEIIGFIKRAKAKN